MARDRASRAVAEDMAAWAREMRGTGRFETAAREGSQPAATTDSTYAHTPSTQSAPRPNSATGSGRQKHGIPQTAGPSGYNRNLPSVTTQQGIRRQGSRRGSVSRRNQRAIDAVLAQDEQEEWDKQAVDALLRHEDAIFAKELIGKEQAEAADRRSAPALDQEGVEGNRQAPQTFTQETHHPPATTAAASAAEDAWIQQLQELRAANEAVEASRRAACVSADQERIAREVQRELDRIRRAEDDNVGHATAQGQAAWAHAQTPNSHIQQAVCASSGVDSMAQEVQRELGRIRRSDTIIRCASTGRYQRSGGTNAASAPASGAQDVLAQGMRELSLDERRTAIRAHTLSRRARTIQSTGITIGPASPASPTAGLQRAAAAPSARLFRRSKTPPSPEQLALLAELY